jgi:hypothetical protein
VDAGGCPARRLPRLLSSRRASGGTAEPARAGRRRSGHGGAPRAAQGQRVALETLWVGTPLAEPVDELAAGAETRAHFAMFLDFDGDRIRRQRNYDCLEPFSQRGAGQPTVEADLASSALAALAVVALPRG